MISIPFGAQNVGKHKVSKPSRCAISFSRKTHHCGTQLQALRKDISKGNHVREHYYENNTILPS